MNLKTIFVIVATLAAGCSQSSDSVVTRTRDLPRSAAAPQADQKETSAKEAEDSPQMDVPSEDSTTPSVAAAETNSNAGNPTDGREPATNSEPIAVTFEDLNLNMQADIVYRPVMMTDRVRELEGKRIKLKGVMLPDARLKKITEFVLLKNIECKFGPGGQADHLAEIKMQGDATANYTSRQVEIEGVLRIEPYQGIDGNTWSIFQIEATSVRGG